MAFEISNSIRNELASAQSVLARRTLNQYSDCSYFDHQIDAGVICHLEPILRISHVVLLHQLSFWLHHCLFPEFVLSR
jgi:hypothetical protein